MSPRPSLILEGGQPAGLGTSPIDAQTTFYHYHYHYYNNDHVKMTFF